MNIKRLITYLLGLLGAYELSHAIVLALGFEWPLIWGGAVVGLVYGLAFHEVLFGERHA